MNQCKYLKMSMILITSKIINDDNNYIENIQRDRWEYLDRKYSKGLVGILRSKIQQSLVL